MTKELLEILSGFKKVLHLIPPYERKLLGVASVLMIINGVLTNLPAVILGKLVDEMIGTDKTSFSFAFPFIATIIFIILVREALTVVRKYFIESIATQTEKTQTIQVIDRLLKTDLSFLHQQQIGSLHGRLFRSIQGLVRLIKLAFLEFLPVFFTGLVALSIAIVQKPLLGSIMALVIPTGFLIVMKQISSQKGIRVSLLRGKEKIDGAVVEMLGGLETIRVLNTTHHEVQKVENITEELRKKEMTHHIAMSLYDSWKYLNEGFFYILVISFSIYLASQGVISRGDILVYSILFLSIVNPLREIHRILDQAHESSILVGDLQELLTQPLDRSFLTEEVRQDERKDLRTVLRVKNLTFKYPDTQKNILDTIDIHIRKGEKIGLVGASGCGKSTFVKILLKLIHGYQGNIMLFGKDLYKLSRTEIAQKIAYVPQKTYLFSGTIRENIVYGSGEHKLSDQEIMAAVQQASIYDEVLHSLGGLDGKVAENGNNLSGGQKQRIALARLILQSPELLIFDEATSALDNTNEAKIQENIEKIFQDKTMITIAHRLSTLKNADRILVFDKGKIVDEGTYSELAKKKGIFADFLRGSQPKILF